jgi:hypothetical protein
MACDLRLKCRTVKRITRVLRHSTDVSGGPHKRLRGEEARTSVLKSKPSIRPRLSKSAAAIRLGSRMYRRVRKAFEIEGTIE